MFRFSLQTGWRFGAGLFALVILVTTVILLNQPKHRGYSAKIGDAPDGKTHDRAHINLADAVRLAVVKHVQPLQVAHFALLRTKPEGLPHGIERVLRKPEFGMNWKLAQRLPIPARGQFWLVPANGLLCLVAQRESGSVSQGCAETREVIAHGIFLAFLSSHPKKLVYGGHRFIVGVIPDGFHEVTIDTLGSKVKVPVVKGVFERRDDAHASPNRLILTMARR